MRVHIEGMGVTGTLLARQLELRGVDFTWHDNDVACTAWKASTGAVYPGGSTKFGPDKECHEVWARWHRERVYGGWTEACAYIYGSKAPPHGGRYHADEVEPYGLRMAEPWSYHLNAQGAVLDGRARWEDRRRHLDEIPARRDVDWYVITHGDRRVAYRYWGWTRLIQLKWPAGVTPFECRPCVYIRPHKFLLAYAYPVPNTPWWYAGSSIIKQREPRELEVVGKYERWEREFLERTGGMFQITARGAFLQGWRPACGDDDWTRLNGNELTFRPLWNSGIRHFPRTWAQVAGIMGLTIDEWETACT